MDELWWEGAHTSFTDKCEWLEKHKQADEIWYNQQTGEPFAAIYNTLNGIRREYPAEFFYNGIEG